MTDNNLTLSLLMSYIYGTAANASKWQMRFNSAFKGLKYILRTAFVLMSQGYTNQAVSNTMVCNSKL
jgi:hypothetical protein